MNPHTNNIDIGPTSQLHINIHCNTHDIDLAKKENRKGYLATPSCLLSIGKARPVLQPFTFPERPDVGPILESSDVPGNSDHHSTPVELIAPSRHAAQRVLHTKAGSGGIYLKDCVEDEEGETGLKTYLPLKYEQRLSGEHRSVDKTPTAQEQRVAALEAVIKMGLAYNVYLNSSKIYGCKNCKTHLSNHDDIVSRNFRGQHGKAYLFDSVVNIIQGEAGERNMTTGRHIVRDIMCKQCNETVGWKYDKAYEQAEKYKEGKYILEAELLCQVT